MAQDLIPDRRLVLIRDADLPGSDIVSIFDTTLEACERARLTNRSCVALTFDTRNGSCFAKSAASQEVFSAGAYCGRAMRAEAAVIAAAADRRAELASLQDGELQAAYDQAALMGAAHVSGTTTAGQHLAWAHDAEAAGDPDLAAQFAGAAINILVTLGDVPERLGRGRETVQALRLAQGLHPHRDTAPLLLDAIARYGFRIVENRVESDLARPRICATFSERPGGLGRR